MSEKNKVIISRIESEIEKIDKKENTIFFFVIDTKGNPSGCLEYIYRLAKITEDCGYQVTMLYQVNQEENEEFVGVRDWLGNEFADLKHENIMSEEVGVSPSDVLFIPEIFANIMIQTKKLPCKRVVIMQNYDFILEQTPISAQWGNFGIVDAITNTEVNAKLLNDIFPYVKTSVVEPYISDMFGETNEPKKMVINIVAKNQDDINKIIKPFYWKYPMFKWVSFRDLRGFPKENFAQLLREGIATIWVDENTYFGYSALEAMKSGSIVLAKTTELAQKWMENEEHNSLNDSCIWFDTFHELHKMIASVVRSWITDKVPQKIYEDGKKVLTYYSYDNTKNQMEEYLVTTLEKRKKEMEELIIQVKNGKDDE